MDSKISFRVWGRQALFTDPVTKIGGELYSDSLGSEGTEGGTYIGMVKANIDTITKALK